MSTDTTSVAQTPPEKSAAAPLLEVTDLRVSFPSEEGRVDAVRG